MVWIDWKPRGVWWRVFQCTLGYVLRVHLHRCLEIVGGIYDCIWDKYPAQ